MSYLGNAGVFLVNVLFGFFEVLVAVRLLMQHVRADFYNPLAQFVVKATNPLLRPLRRVIPPLGRFDSASLVLWLLLTVVELSLITLLIGRPFPAPAGLLLWSLADMLNLLIWIWLFYIFVLAIASWINPGSYNPALAIMDRISEPVLKPVRRLLPPMGGLDLSPMLAILALYLAQMLLVAPLRDLAFRLAA